jgi:hypothetical protein
LGVALLYAIHGTILENTLFKDGDGTNTFHIFNPTQTFLNLKKKLLLTDYGARANMLVIILLRNDYFLFFLKKYIDVIFFYFFKFILYIITLKQYKNIRKKIFFFMWFSPCSVNLLLANEHARNS